jgi:hypothetical protein
MASLMGWVRSRLQGVTRAAEVGCCGDEFQVCGTDTPPTALKVAMAWCVHCRTRRTVRQVAIVPGRTARRLVGECRVCHGETSTFVTSG